MGDSLLAAMVSATAGLVLGGLFLDGAGDVVAVVGGITVLTGATARYGAVLMRRSEKTVTRYTAIGFFIGLVISVGVVVADAIWG